MKNFGEIAFTEHVKAEQEKHGSREAYAGMTARPAPAGLTEAEAQFISRRDSFYMATVSEDGWPYVQHRGGPAGFLRVLSPTQIGFADYRGNRQYVSVGNLQTDKRVSLFLMDYVNRRRLKMLGRASVVAASADRQLAERIAVDGQGKVERLFIIQVDAFDWNCPQFITPRFTQEELGATLTPIVEELQTLRQENAFLKAELNRS
ncbi:MAG: pyridoxamine 5'-phosphate oxidase family protein [Henriciella sp.]|jgi:predicted pyridoxine 5'-phosphate oxidase superfamily flavin-nucleotide-binding protein